MKEKETYTPTEIAQFFKAALRIYGEATTTREKLERYEKFVPKNVEEEISRLQLLVGDFYRRAGREEGQKYNPANEEDAKKIKGFEEFLKAYDMMVIKNE